MTTPVKALRDSAVVTRRNLITIVRIPDLAIGATVQPLMFVLLFSYVFGSSLGGESYREFLLGGIFAQTVAFNAAFTTVGLANDLQKGIIDRLRSLPMSRMAVILGRSASDLVLSAVTLVVMALCGLVVGWRIHGSVGEAVLAFALLLLFAFAMSMVGAWVGLLARNVEVAQSAGLIWLFPFTFISSAFVSAASLPGPLRAIAEWNPVTAVASAARSLFGNSAPAQFAVPTGWPAQHDVLYSLLTSLAIVVVFLPLAVNRYRRVASR
ncbi:ABC transporter permease [Rhodococcus sp. X156]|uniref:ABC transporter permease n=1 Tax=Rhodococcus sp. X156 TaxID=2499145 RepID=UPI000FD8E784|nr:ABC transporter permease [Rhodococcus sp. X156]